MENEIFKDRLVHATCFSCGTHLTLMESVRGGTDELWLVTRCLQCGESPVKEVVRLK